jgi:hypothetical protein
MPVARLRALVRTVRLGYRTRLARRGELDALAQAGARLVSAPEVPAGLAPDALAAVLRLGREIDTLAHAIARTRDADRADWLTVSPWMRPVVAGRGLASRLVLRDRQAGCRRDMRPHHIALGRAALTLQASTRARLGLTETLTRATRAAEELNALGVAPADRPLPVRQSPAPAWAGRARVEAGSLGRAVGKQLHGQLFPRASALAGMAAGWWVASTYTDSHVRSVLRSVGIGSGGTRVVSGETYRAMSFWLPILAAGLCAYLGDRLAGYIRRRYDVTAEGDDSSAASSVAWSEARDPALPRSPAA